MSVATEVNAVPFEDIEVGVPLNCSFPLHAEAEVIVVYGSQALIAVLNSDYTVQLAEDFESFTITPLQALLDKINALIADPPTDDDETNFVVVRRYLPYGTTAEAEIVRDTKYLSKEIDRISMKLIQLNERMNRALRVPANRVGDALTSYTLGLPIEGYIPIWQGNKLVAAIDGASLADVTGFADQVEENYTLSQALLADMQSILDDVQAAALLLPLNNYTATTNPTVNDDLNDGYTPGSEWINTLTGDRFSCSNATVGAAVWTEISADLSALGDMAYEDKDDYLLIADFSPQAIRQIPQNSKSADYTCVLTDGGKHIFHPASDGSSRTFTIPANASVAYDIGTAITFVNEDGAGSVSIAINSDTLVLSGDNSTGTRTLAPGGMATALKVKSDKWMISGTGIT